jgi:histidinol dehydrogenase
MLRIVNQLAEVRAELSRIGDRLPEAEIWARENSVREILTAVKEQGDCALIPSSDGSSQQPLRLSGADLDAAYQQISKELLDAIRLSCHQIEAFHRQRLPKSWVQFGEQGTVIGKRYTPLERVGIYIPGGEFPSISRVLLLSVPARIARVPQIAIATPPGAADKIHPALLVAAQEAGVQEIYRLGGAAAIAAFVWGTETVGKVEAIFGSGGLEVMLAKRLVWGEVGIDSPLEASDFMAIADATADATEVAAQMLAQAEQDLLAAAILLTPDRPLAEAVQREVWQQLQEHPQRLLTEKAIAHYGLIAVVDSLESAIELANAFAPQILHLEVSDPWDALEKVRQAGTIFLGGTNPHAIGSYLGGLSPHLPGGGMARYGGTVGVEAFLKQTNLIEYSPASLRKLERSLQVLAQAEGRPASARALDPQNP